MLQVRILSNSIVLKTEKKKKEKEAALVDETIGPLQIQIAKMRLMGFN